MVNDIPTVSSVNEDFEEIYEIKLQKGIEHPRIEQMFDGQTGFVRPNALFADDNKKLHLMASEAISRFRSREFYIKIKKENGQYLVEKKSLEKDPSQPGYFNQEIKKFFIPVKIVRLLEKTVADMLEGEIGFVMPSSIILAFFGRYFINTKVVYYSRAFGISNLKIKRVGDVILAETIHIEGHIGKEPTQKMPVNPVKKI